MGLIKAVKEIRDGLIKPHTHQMIDIWDLTFPTSNIKDPDTKNGGGTPPVNPNSYFDLYWGAEIGLHPNEYDQNWVKTYLGINSTDVNYEDMDTFDGEAMMHTNWYIHPNTYLIGGIVYRNQSKLFTIDDGFIASWRFKRYTSADSFMGDIGTRDVNNPVLFGGPWSSGVVGFTYKLGTDAINHKCSFNFWQITGNKFTFVGNGFTGYESLTLPWTVTFNDRITIEVRGWKSTIDGLYYISVYFQGFLWFTREVTSPTSTMTTSQLCITNLISGYGAGFGGAATYQMETAWFFCKAHSGYNPNSTTGDADLAPTDTIKTFSDQADSNNVIVKKTDSPTFNNVSARETVTSKVLAAANQVIVASLTGILKATNGLVEICTGADLITLLGFTPEDVANKDTSDSLGTSDTKYPSQGAVKSYVDTAVSGISASSDNVQKAGLTCDSGVAAKDIVYEDSAGTWQKAIGSAVATKARGVVLSKESGTSCTILFFGKYASFGTGMTPGTKYYLSTTSAGAVITTFPDLTTGTTGYVIQKTGYAFSATDMFFDFLEGVVI